MKPTQLSLDTQEIDQPQNTYRYGKNGVWNAQLRSNQNENGFLPTGIITPYTIIGVIETDTYPVYFSTDNTNSAFGFHDTDSNVYVPIFDDAALSFKLKFNINRPIMGEARRNFRNDIELTWLELGENRNPPRWANTSRLGISENDFLLFPKFLTPYIDTSVQSGGNLSMGAYFIAARYIKKDGTETRYTTPTRPVMAIGDNWGSVPGNNTGKAIKITITGVDSNFDRIQLAVIERINGVDSAYLLPELPVTTTSEFIYTGAEKGEAITLDEVLIPSGYYENARAITQLNDQLFLANMDEEEIIDWQQYASMIKLRWKSELIDVTSAPDSIKSGSKRGWMHQEVGCFYAMLKLKNGRNSQLFIIPGPQPLSSDTANSSLGAAQGLAGKTYQLEDTCRNINTTDKSGDFGVWINQNETYPDTPDFDSTAIGGENLRGLSVRHHRFPSLRFCKQNFYQTDTDYGNYKLDILGVAADNVIIPAELQDKVLGWEIFYARRDYANSLVMGQSLLMFGAQSNDDPSEGSITSTGGNWGSYQRTHQKGDTNSPEALKLTTKYFRFHSFDLLLNKPSISPTHLDLQLSEQSQQIYAHSTAYTSKERMVFVIDYTDQNSYVPAVTVPSFRLLRIDEGRYTVNNVISGRYSNLRLEAAYVGRIYNPPANLAPWTWAKFDYDNGNNNQPDTEQTYLTNLMTTRSDLYISFYSQVPVRTGQVFPATVSSSVDTIYGGDSFVSRMSFNTYGLATKRDVVDDTGEEDWHTTAADGIKAVHEFVGESNANPWGRYEIAGNDYSKFYPKSLATPNGGYLGTESRNIEPNQYGYIKDVNAIGDLLNGISIASPYDEVVERSPYKIVRSAKQVREGSINSWKNFNALDYYETVKNKGEITNLQGFNDKLIIHHADAFFLTRDKATLSADVLKITLGSGDIFEFEPSEARPSKLGYAGTTNPLACVLTPVGYIFPDTRTGELFLFNGQRLDNIGTGLINFLLKYLTVKEINVFAGNGITIGYEQKLKRIFLTLKNRTANSNNYTFVPNFKATPEFFALLTPNQSVVYKDGTYQLFKGLNTSEYECDVNPLPLLSDYNFASNEHVAVGTLIGTVAATGGVLPYTYVITSSDSAGLSVNPLSGQIKVINSAQFDASKSVLHLIVKVTDANGNTDTGTVNVTINDVPSTPVLPAYAQTIPEHTANGTAVVTAAATDADGKTITYSITGGNTGGAFAINSSTGQITVANSTALEYDTNPTFSLIVRATAAGGNYAENTVTISLTEVVNAPIATSSSFNIAQTSNNGDVVGTVTPATNGGGVTGDLIYELKTDSTPAGAFIVITDPNDADYLKIKVLDKTKLDAANNPNVITMSVYNVGHPATKTDFTETITVVNPIACGMPVPFSGGESFPFEQIITLGSGTGTVTLTYDALDQPDKFIVIFDGAEVINTGYRGASSYQTDLNTALAGRGLPPETIMGTGAGSASFTKGTATTTATVRVYAPLSGTAWSFTLSCPV